MGYFTILMPREYAWEVLNQLGELDALQFVDLNADQAAFNKPYANFVKRCDEMENKVEIIMKEMDQFKKKTIKCDNVETFLVNLKKFLSQRQKAERTYFDEVESELNEKLKGLLEQVRIRDTLIEKYDHLVEYRQVLFRAYSFISGTGSAAQDLSISSDRMTGADEERKMDLGMRGGENIRFTYLAGVINKEDSLRFKRILFRMTRGMVWTTLMDIERPQTEAEKNDFDHLMDTSSETKLKTVFLIVYQGGAHAMMAGKLNKICDSFGASKYGLPADKTSYDRKLIEVESQLKEAKSVISVTDKHIDMILEYFARPRTPSMQYSLIEELKLFIMKEKVIYDNLNKLKSQNTLYRGCCWCTTRNVPRVYDTIAQLKASRSGIGGCEFQEISRPTDSTPPTHFETNDVTWAFQEIVNTYGIPRYREINPGLFAIATFPFLFGVMFGDIGHGALLFLAGLYLVIFKKAIEDDKTSMLRLLIPARYLILLQGFFAFYCGLIYNDFMSLTFNLFGTCYTSESADALNKDIDCVYSVGMDGAWGGKANELTYVNSFKMKLAIILGVSQMLFGILLRGWNCINFKNWVDFFCEFVPMFIFMSLTFGYMVVLIFLKWSMPWGTQEYPTSQAPSIIGIFIKMVLEPGKWPEGAGIPLYGDASGEYQAKTQFHFLIIAGICSLIILIPKPLILYWKHRKGTFYNLIQGHHDRTMDRRLLNNPEHPELELVQHHDEEQKDDSQEHKLLDRSRSNSSHSFSNLELDDHFEFGEVFVHQVIEAIEFVLGSISSTASYLRLWALSLAHSQLAKVFFDNCIKSSIQSASIIGLFVGFIIFAQLTLGVLLLMDQMECFLHALRLHWVEFQNKFYKADGYAFIPFSYKRAVAQHVSQ